MNNILNAEEFANGMLGKEQYPTDTPYCMIEFAKRHVQAALKAAAENAKARAISESSYEPSNSYGVVIKDSILNAYPLENIK